MTMSLAQRAAMRSAIKREHKANAVLDAFFGQYYIVEQVTRSAQRRGVDRYMRPKGGGRLFTVEYKADCQASVTGNVFVETVSVESSTVRKLGWALTCESDLLAYFVPATGSIYLYRTVELRKHVVAWRALYPERTCRNPDYDSRGLAVPVEEFGRHCDFLFVERDGTFVCEERNV